MNYKQPAKRKADGMTMAEVEMFLEVTKALVDNGRGVNVQIRANVSMGGKIKEMFATYDRTAQETLEDSDIRFRENPEPPWQK